MNSYLAAGVDAHLLRVMPIGIDTNLYNPERTHARRLFPKELDGELLCVSMMCVHWSCYVIEWRM